MMKSLRPQSLLRTRKPTPQRISALGKTLIGLLFTASLWLVSPATFADNSLSNSTIELDKRKLGPSGLPLPRFVSFRSGEVNMRAGPGTRYPISWIYHRRRLPIEIVDEFDTWRQIRDWQGTVGWVHQSMLKGQRSMMVTGAVRTIFDDPEPGSRPVLQAEAGVIGELESCNSEGWCQVEIKDITGWLKRSSLYGSYKDEVFD